MNNSLIRLIVPGIVAFFTCPINQSNSTETPHTGKSTAATADSFALSGNWFDFAGPRSVVYSLGAADMGGISERIPDSSGTRSDDRFSILNWFSRHLFLPALVQPALMH